MKSSPIECISEEINNFVKEIENLNIQTISLHSNKAKVAANLHFYFFFSLKIITTLLPGKYPPASIYLTVKKKKLLNLQRVARETLLISK